MLWCTGAIKAGAKSDRYGLGVFFFMVACIEQCTKLQHQQH
jgi:hypothetical protein